MSKEYRINEEAVYKNRTEKDYTQEELSELSGV